MMARTNWLGTGLTIAALVAAAPEAAEAAIWKLDVSRSTLKFSGTQTGNAFQGAFNRFTGTVDFDPDHLETSSIRIMIDLASASTGDPQRDTALPGKDWFSVAQSPKATFEATTIRAEGPDRYQAIGHLTLRGISKPLILPFKLEMKGASAHATGRVEISRDEFGVGQGSWASGQWVGLAVSVDVDIYATREP
jgi:polyisoprenoid-binding protein YceI